MLVASQPRGLLNSSSHLGVVLLLMNLLLVFVAAVDKTLLDDWKRRGHHQRTLPSMSRSLSIQPMMEVEAISMESSCLD